LLELQASKVLIADAEETKDHDNFRFALGSTQIPSITEKPVKSLGNVFDCSLRDTASIRATNQELEAWLGAVDKARTTRLVQGLDIPTQHPP